METVEELKVRIKELEKIILMLAEQANIPVTTIMEPKHEQ